MGKSQLDDGSLVGSALAKDGSLPIPDVSNIVSGTLKMVFRQLKYEEPSKSSTKPRDDILLVQVSSLRNELQLLGSNKPLAIVTTSESDGKKYAFVIITGVIGYGYVWWKGWKLSDFMFATRRSLSNARTDVGSQIDGVYSSLSGTKKELNSQIHRAVCRLDANTETIEETGLEVIELQGGLTSIKDEFSSVLDAVEALKSKVHRIEENQDITLRGVGALHAKCLESQRIQEANQALPSTPSMPALEAAPMTPSSRTLSLPPVSPCESQSPSTPNGAHQHTHSMSGLKDVSETSSSRETFSNGTYSGGNGASGSSSSMLGRFSIPRIVSAVNRVPTN